MPPITISNPEEEKQLTTVQNLLRLRNAKKRYQRHRL
jgi:hypothetical protein